MQKNKNNTIVFKVSDNIKQEMIEFYQDRKTEKTPPYAIFQVKDFDCVTTLYESGKVMFQGIAADIESSYWTEKERVMNNNIIDTSTSKKDKKEEKKIFINDSSIGSDEVGTGDYFGPLVVTASYVDKKHFSMLQELGVRDSKKLTDDKIIQVAPTLIKNIPHTSIVLSNQEYNKYHSTSTNMNKIKAILHNKCLLSVIEKEKNSCTTIVVDQFEPPASYYKHLKEVPKKVQNITFLTKAEDQCLSVAVASIISRYIFLKEIKKLSEEMKIEIPLGASTMVDDVGVTLVNKYGEKILEKIAKLNFKNTEKIKEKMKS